jgi:hypothetical protein
MEAGDSNRCRMRTGRHPARVSGGRKECTDKFEGYCARIAQSERKIPVGVQPVLPAPSVIRQRMLAVQILFAVHVPVDGCGS